MLLLKDDAAFEDSSIRDAHRLLPCALSDVGPYVDAAHREITIDWRIIFSRQGQRSIGSLPVRQSDVYLKRFFRIEAVAFGFTRPTIS